ncbi:hypothetical protein F8M41_000056 [Gigaspora margarita]|uniref:Uncharacterized protein n=1 Tax=Gigaspora margarita TaxID=4874 RepID=A0A8H4B622_GIGMA|nr:hypothetical protein F8M41_000056 [Gigaspora margarita]
MEESARREAENVELKARIVKLEQTAEENTELKNRITKLERKQMQAITNNQEPSSTKDISPLIESHSDKEKGITPNPLPEIKHISTQAQRGKSLDSSESLTEPETSTTSLPQDIIDDDSAEILDFVEMIHKERITLWDQNQNKSQNKTSQHQCTLSRLHKKKGTENIAQVIVDGIQDNNLLDESKIQSFASSNHMTEISATALRQNSSTVLLLDLAQLFDKATDVEYSAIKANQKETLCWINYGNEFIIQYNNIIKNSNGKIGEKKAKGIIYDKILEHLIIIRKRRSKEMGIQLPEISCKSLCKKTQKAVKTFRLFEKIGIDKIKYLKSYSANSISEITNEQIQKIIDNFSEHNSES